MLADVVRHRSVLGQSTLLITHALADAGRICERVLVLVGGRLVHDGPTSALCGVRGVSLEPALARLYQEVAR